MADYEKMVVVKNRNVGSTGYTFENGFHRKFEVNEEKKIPLSELMQLSYLPGGEYILKNCLVVNDKNALEALNMSVEPEYFYSEKEVKEILLNGTLDQLEDTLNFAPDGVIEMIKKIAVETEVPDVRKRDMISKKTGFNINNAISINHQLADGETETKEEQSGPKRKTTPLNVTPEAPTRKTVAPDKYKVVSK